MKRILVAILVAGLVRFAFYEYHAQQSPGVLTDAQLPSFQDGVAVGCKKNAVGRGVETEKAESYCNCLVNVMKSEFTKSEWQRAYEADRQKNKEEAKNLFDAHREKLQVCQQYER